MQRIKTLGGVFPKFIFTFVFPLVSTKTGKTGGRIAILDFTAILHKKSLLKINQFLLDVMAVKYRHRSTDFGD